MIFEDAKIEVKSISLGINDIFLCKMNNDCWNENGDLFFVWFPKEKQEIIKREKDSWNDCYVLKTRKIQKQFHRENRLCQRII